METAIKIIRDKFPALRRTSSTAIVHSGGRATVFGCLCGSYHTTSTDYRGREARHVREWQKEHAACSSNLVTRIESLRLVSRQVAYGCNSVTSMPVLTE